MKSIFITGAGSGIGKAAAEIFCKQGWQVGLADRDVAGLNQVTQDLGNLYGSERVSQFILDVTDADACKAVLAEFVYQTGGNLDVLLNNAGLLKTGAFEDIAIDTHQALVDVNVSGVINMAYGAFDYLRNTPGAMLLNMSSASAVYGVPTFASYAATKFAVRGLTEGLNVEWDKHDIYVADIMPPFVKTPMLMDGGNNAPEIVDRLGIHLGAADIAEVIFQVANGKSRQVHYPISLQLKVLMRSAGVLPGAVARKIMKALSGS